MHIDPVMLREALQILIALSPLVLVICLFFIFWPLWVKYIRAENFFKEKYCLLEIKLPKETVKSPAAMELFLTALHQTGGEANWYDKYWLGKVRAWFSLEIVSIEGQVHFFIWTRSGLKNFVESSLYGQFPGIEVHEMSDDYAKSVHYDPKEMAMWGCEFKYAKKNPYPIKTYVDYGLDKDPKEEYKIDPLAPMLEFLGSVGANQQLWLQFIIRAHKEDAKKPGHWWKMHDSYKAEAEEEINKILVRDPKTKTPLSKDEEGNPARLMLSPGEQDVVKALERALTKPAYDVGIRAIYMAKKDFFVGTNIPGLLGSFKQFGSEHLNSIRISGDAWSPTFSYPWQDFREIRQNRMRHFLLEVYKRRSFFFDPYVGTPLVMNSEEVATIFHFPGQVAATPTLKRIQSKKGQAPANLPI
jgi:hypothetical protein